MGVRTLGRLAVLCGLVGVAVRVATVAPPDPRSSGAGAEEALNSAGPWQHAFDALPADYIWIDRERLQQLPTEGPAWQALRKVASSPVSVPDLADQDDATDVAILAKALVYAKTSEAHLRQTVIQACMAAIGSQRGGRALALAKGLIAYPLAADLVGLPPDADRRFRAWLQRMLSYQYPSGKTLRSTHEHRPNNWGTYAGASRLAIAAYLGDRAEFERAARVFKGWLGDRSAYSAFEYKDGSWQAMPSQPVGINPAGARRQGHSIDGVLPDDQRRGGAFQWPPPRVNYVYSALQGATAQAILLQRAGYRVWQWEDAALRRAFEWLHDEADYPAAGDDTWQPHVINYHYGTGFPAPVPTEPGKNVGWTGWTHGSGPRSTPGPSGPKSD
jgi:hypothetical protein